MPPRVHRGDNALTLYLSRVPFWVALAATALAAIALGFAVARGNHGLGSLLAPSIGVVVFGALTSWFVGTGKPVLEVDIRGVRAPKMLQPETVGWGRIALIRKGDSWAQSSLEVFFWADARDHARGTKGGLHIPAMALPMKIDAIVEEMQSIQAAVTTERRDGP